MTVGDYVADFASSLNARRFQSMNHDGGKLVFPDVLSVSSHDTLEENFHKRLRVFNQNGAFPPETHVAQLDIPNIQCREEVG